MEQLISFATEWWNTLVPTSWMLLLGLLVSIHVLRKTLW